MPKLSLFRDQRSSVEYFSVGLLAMKNGIGEELDKSNMASKETKSKVSLAQNPKAQRKLINHDNDSEKTFSFSSYQKTKDNQAKARFFS